MDKQSNYLRAHFPWRHRAVSWLSRLFANQSYTCRHGLITGMKRKGGLGFIPTFLMPKSFHNAEFEFFQNLDLRGKTVYDVGGFEGLLSLFFSSRAKNVITYEPSPVNYKRLMETLALNEIDNGVVRNVAVGDQVGVITLSYDPGMTGGTTADPALTDQLSHSASRQVVSVPVVMIDQDALEHHTPPPDFVKIDIEGFELPALRGMSQILRQHHPDLYLEMHGATEAEKERSTGEIVLFLTEVGYRRILHVESGQTVTPANAALARRGHLFAQVA